MPENQPLDHVARARLPWHPPGEGLTECGRQINDVASVIERDDLIRKVRRDGVQRASYTSCMNCWNRVQYTHTWETCPSSLLHRLTDSSHAWTREHTDTDLDRELRAIAALIEAHRNEFDEYVTGLAQTVDLAEHRRRRKS